MISLIIIILNFWFVIWYAHILIHCIQLVSVVIKKCALPNTLNHSSPFSKSMQFGILIFIWNFLSKTICCHPITLSSFRKWKMIGEWKCTQTGIYHGLNWNNHFNNSIPTLTQILNRLQVYLYTTKNIIGNIVSCMFICQFNIW